MPVDIYPGISDMDFPGLNFSRNGEFTQVGFYLALVHADLQMVSPEQFLFHKSLEIYWRKGGQFFQKMFPHLLDLWWYWNGFKNQDEDNTER